MNETRTLPEFEPEDFDQYDGQVIEPQRRRLQPYHVTELGSRSRREYVVKGLFDRGGLAEMFGDTNSGKTFTALDIAEHIAQGWDWCGRKVKPGPVVYIAVEGGLGLEERLTAFRQHHGVDQADVPLYIIPAGIDLCSADSDAKTLIDEIQRLGTVQLVVIDTLARALAGGNENAPDDMGAFVLNCDRIREATGAAVLVVHHSGKDQSRGGRGHSSLKAAVDTEILVENVNSLITVTVTKQRDYPSGDTFTFKLEPVEIGTDEDGDPITSCVLLPADKDATNSQRTKVSGQAKVALDLLDRAIADAGEIPPASNHIPGQIHVVPLTLWRQYCYEGLIGDRDNRDTIRRAFNRTSKKLQELGVIGTWQDWVWTTGQPGQGGTT